MNKLFYKIAQFVLCGFLLTSCKTVTKSHSADYDYMYITKQGIKQRPLVTDLEVSKTKVTFTRTYANVRISEAKENALGDFIQQNNCDLVVQPFFETNTVTENEKTTVTVTLMGYPAFYRNIRNFELKDTSAFLLNTYYNGTSVPVVAPVSMAPKASATSTTNSVMQKIKSGEGGKFGLSANAAMPIGDFKNYYQMAIGGSLNYLVQLSKQVDFTTNATFLSFSGKDVTYYYPGGSYTTKFDALTSISAKFGVRYKTPYSVFVEPQIGYTFLDDESGFSYGAGVGYNLTKKIDITLQYDHTSLSSEGFNYLGIKAGFYF